jgi:hypothetical protein
MFHIFLHSFCDERYVIAFKISWLLDLIHVKALIFAHHSGPDLLGKRGAADGKRQTVGAASP